MKFKRALGAAFAAVLVSNAYATQSENPPEALSTRLCLLSENAPEFISLEDKISAGYLADYKRGALTLPHMVGMLLKYSLRHPGLGNAFKRIADQKREEGLDVDNPDVKADLLAHFFASVEVMEQRNQLCPERDARLKL